MKIDIHADDFALTINTSKDILGCMRAGKLDSISIVPNMSCFEECMDMLYTEIAALPFLPRMSVHVNLVEGVPLFKGLDGMPAYESLSWGRLYLYNWILGKQSPVRKSINEEVMAQIAKCQSAIDKCISLAKQYGIKCKQTGLRIDSHQHTHMIPIVWDACLEAADRLKLDLEYIRNSHEPLMVFIKNRSLTTSYRAVNIVKNRLLAFHSKKVDSLCDETGLDKMYLWGLIMSGNMDINRVSTLFKDVTAYSDKKNRTLEILFHPGTALPLEVNDELNSEAVKSFYLSEGREEELETVMEYDFDRTNK